VITLASIQADLKIVARGTYAEVCDNGVDDWPSALAAARAETMMGESGTTWSIGADVGEVNTAFTDDFDVAAEGGNAYIDLYSMATPLSTPKDLQYYAVGFSHVLVLGMEVISPDYGADATKLITVTSVGVGSPDYGWSSGPIGTIKLACPSRMLFVRPPGDQGWPVGFPYTKIKLSNPNALAAVVRVMVAGRRSIYTP